MRAVFVLLFMSLFPAVPFLGAAQPATTEKRNYKEGEKAIRKGNYDRAVTIYTGIIERDPKDLLARLGLALAHLKMLHFVSCFEEASEAIKIDEKNARAFALRGVAMLRSGFLEKAADQLVHALELSQKDALAYGGLAEIDYYENRVRDSRQKAAVAAALDPNEADYLHTLARASSRLEMFTEAADAYEQFLIVAPKTDVERRDRIRGLIQLYRRLAGLRLHQIDGPKESQILFALGSDRRPYIEIRVNGRAAKFVIDTGSGFTVISDVAAKRLRVPAIARGGNSQGFGGDGKFPIVYGLLNSLQLADMKIESVPCFIRKFHVTKDRPKEEHADGFIGLSVLSNFVTELDYGNRLMKLSKVSSEIQAADRPPDATVVSFRTTQNGLISIPTQLNNGLQINAIVDSGASSSVISRAAVKRLNMQDSIIQGQTVQVIGAAGVTDNVELLFIRNCQVADLQQDNLRALVLDFGTINEFSGFEQSGILGGDFLRHFRLTIDFYRAQIALVPQTTAITRQQPAAPKIEKN